MTPTILQQVLNIHEEQPHMVVAALGRLHLEAGD
jgi:hypothetical protein